MKRIISVILALVIGVTMFGVNTEAASYEIKSSKTYKNGYTYVTLTPSEGTVYYTTDGTKPNKKDKKYTKKIKITEPTTLRMTIYSDGKAVKSFSAKIAVRTKKPEISVKELKGNKYEVTFSAASNADIYYTLNGKTPSETSGKKLGSSKTITVDGGVKLKAIAVEEGWKNSTVMTEKMPNNKASEYVEEVLRLVNEERWKYGLLSFTTTDALNEAAAARANELVEKNSHMRPDGKSWSTIFREYKIKDNAMGENIAAGYATPEDVVKGWMSSPANRDNILSVRCSKIGIGYVEAEGEYDEYWSMLFAR